jgi:hypothetical protein
MTALQMQLELKRLALKHGVVEATPCIIPLSDPIDHDLIFEGLAATPDIDHARMKFRGCGWSFTILP